MKVVVGEIVPLALVVTISPVNVIPVILLLFTKRPLATSACFLAGLVSGVVRSARRRCGDRRDREPFCELRPLDLGGCPQTCPRRIPRCRSGPKVQESATVR